MPPASRTRAPNAVGPKNGEPADELLGFGERAVGHGQLPLGEPYARPKGAWQAAFGGKQPAGLHHALDQLAHLGHFLL